MNNLLNARMIWMALLLALQVACSSSAQPAQLSLTSSPMVNAEMTPDKPEVTEAHRPTLTISPSPLTSPTPKVAKTKTPTLVPTFAPSVSFIKLHEWIVGPPPLLGNKLAWAPEGNRFVILTFEGVEMYDARSFERQWMVPSPFPADGVSGVVFSPDGMSLILYRSLSGLEVRDANSGELLQGGDQEELNLDCPGEAFGLALAPNGQTLYIGVDSTRKGATSTTIYKWDLASLQCLGEFASLPGFRRFLDQSSNDRYLAIGTSHLIEVEEGEVVEEGQTWVWDLETEQQICAFDAPLAVFWPQTNILFVPGEGKVDGWVRETCELANGPTLPGIPAPNALAISPTEAFLVLLRERMWVVDIFSGEVLLSINDLAFEDVTGGAISLDRKLSFSPDGHLLLSIVRNPQNGIESVIILWRVERVP